MKKKWLKMGKRTMAVALAAVMAASGAASATPLVSEAAGTPAEREDSTIVYAVDCGDLNVTTVPEDGPLGTHNSVTDQIYGEDEETGYYWGIDDDPVGGSASNPSSENGPCGVGGVSTNWTWPYEMTTSDQTSKLSTNRYTKNQYEKGIEERHLDYKFEIENGSYYVEVGCTDPWGCSKTPNVYANYQKDNQVVLAEGLNIAGGDTANGAVTVTDGELTINLRATGSDNLAINVTYIIIKEAGDSSLVQTDLDSITVKETATGNIALPTVGKAGSTITWNSSNPTVITNDGKVTRPAAGEEDITVTLTATVKYGEASKTKDFTVTVPAQSDLTGMEELGITNVTVTDPYYVNSLEKEIDYLLLLDADRLLAGFRETAAYAAGMTATERTAYMQNKTRYGGGWEDALIGGHTLGHWLTAMAQACVNEGTSAEDKEALKEKLNYVIEALKDCQDKTAGTEYEGYLFGAKLASTTDLDIQFDNVEKNKTNIATEAWVPWYTMHKIQAGLISAYELAGIEDAYDVAKKLGDWTYNRVSKWTAATQKTVLGIEYGGMNDCLYDLYAMVKAKEGETAAAKYAEAAHKFDELDLFELISKGTKNAVDGKHANTTIPKFLGALKRYMVLGEEESKYLEYVETFWDYVLNHHSYITGGNSEWEHFGADDILDAERTNCNCETCNTYNMLKMTRQLFMITGDPKYTDYYENTLINAIMSSQNPESGMSMYFQPMASGYQKVFGTAEDKFWCCTGSGMENFTKLNDSIYYQKDNTLVVAQYLASTVKFEAGNMKVTQAGDLTKSEKMSLTVNKLADGDISGELRLRLPDWLADDATITIDGTTYDYTVKDSYAVIPADELADGIKVEITLPMEVVAYNLPDGENTYAFKYGPYVLSAKLGTSGQSVGTTGVNVSIPTTKAIANDRVAITSADTVSAYMDDIDKNLVKTEGKMEFQLKGTNNKYTFVPHYSQYEESYAIYWTFSVDEDARGSEAIIGDKNAARVENAVIEGARPGYGQDELGFEEAGNGSTGSSSPCWRYANAGGSFKYDIKVTDSGDNYLICAFAKEDDGKTIKIVVGDTEIFAGTLDSNSEDAININLPVSDAESYYQMRFKIPANVIAANKKNTRMEGTEEKTAADGYTFIPVTFSSNDDNASAKIGVMLYMMRAYRTENDLTEITSSTGTITKSGTEYKLVVPYNEEAKVKLSISDSAGYVMIDDNAIDEEDEKTLVTTGVETTFNITVVAEDFETKKEYTLKVVYDYNGFDNALKQNFVAGYSFNDTVGDAVAVTKAAVPVQVENPNYAYVEGKDGKALKLSGSYGLKLQGASELGESYTISWWMKPDNLGNNSTVDPTFVGGTFDPQYWLNATLDAKIWSYKGGYIETPIANAYKVDEWQHVVIVVDGDIDGTASDTVVGTLYVDGIEVSKGNVAKGIMTNTGAQLYFGVNAWDAYFQGALDEVLLFDKALSIAEIQGLTDTEVKAGDLGAEDTPKDDPDDDTTGPDDDSTPGSDDTTPGSDDTTPGSDNNNTGGNNAGSNNASDNNTNTNTSTNTNGTTDNTSNTTVKKGTTVKDTSSGGSYKVTTGGTSSKATVAYVKPIGKAAKATSITIPATVKVNGVTCKVTSIQAKAFANNKKLKTLTVGKNITKIGKKAFYKCTKIKTLKIKATKLTKKNIGKNVFKGINAKVKIKVPKSKLKTYKKIFRSRGLSKKVKISKL